MFGLEKRLQGPARRLSPEQGASLAQSFGHIFGETSPALISSTPRPTTSNVKAPSENLANAPLAVAYGWIGGVTNRQVKGMSVLYVDQINPLPAMGIRTHTQSTIGESGYAPFNHYRAAHWLFAGWDPIQRFANTQLDMRFAVGHPEPLSNIQPYNLPGSVRMGPYFAPFRTAMQVPRFSQEPNTIIPRPQPGR